MSTAVNPQKVDELAAEFTRLKRVLENRERAIHREISQLINSTNAKYDESYVRATTSEMESLLREIQTLSASITERLQDKSTVLKQAAHQFRIDEEQAKRRSRGVKASSFKTKLGRTLPSFYRIARRGISTKNHQYKVINSILGKAKNKFTQLKMDDPFTSLRNKVIKGTVTMKQAGSSIANKGKDFVETGKRNIEVSKELGNRLLTSFKESWKGRYGTSVQDYIARELYYKNKGRLEGLWNFGKHTVEGVIDTGKFVFEHSTPVMIYKEIREPGYHKQKIEEHVERAKYIYADPKGYAKEVWEVVKQEMIQPVVDDFDEQYIHGDFKSRAEYEGRIEGYAAPMFAGGFILKALKIPSVISKMPTSSKKVDVGGSQNKTINTSESNTTNVTGKGDSILNNSTLPQTKIDEIIATPKGVRPDPSTYLPPEYIANHLTQFENGATRFMVKSNLEKYGIGQRDGTSFIMSKHEAEMLLASTNKNPRALEKALGLPENFLESHQLVRVDISNPKELNLRIPSGNEAGANEFWIPGGKLPNGYLEGVIDVNGIPKTRYTETPITN